MAITKQDVDRWIATARERKATHIISVCDTFDHDDYPVYVLPGENLEEKKSKYNGKNMQIINEIITIKYKKQPISADNFLATVAANINNKKLSDKGFRQFIRNTLPSVEYKK
jgi:hypothetical protein